MKLRTFRKFWFLALSSLSRVDSDFFFFSSKLPNTEKKLIASLRQHAKNVLNTVMNVLWITRLGQQYIKQRPFVALFVSAFLATSFLPLLIYLLFAGTVAFLGLSLLVVIVGGIITMATVILLVCLIIPACIASGLSLSAYTAYVGLSQIKIIVTSTVNGPQQCFGGEGLKEGCDKKPRFTENVRFRATRITSDVSGKDCNREILNVQGGKADSSQHPLCKEETA